MLETPAGNSPEELAQALLKRAAALWGEERASALRPYLEQTAESLWTLSKATLEAEAEPGFFM